MTDARKPSEKHETLRDGTRVVRDTLFSPVNVRREDRGDGEIRYWIEQDDDMIMLSPAMAQAILNPEILP